MATPKRIKGAALWPNFTWSELLDPIMVKPRNLPATAGNYVVVACDANGRPIKLPNEPPHSQMKGVVYIGLTRKANTLRKRFAALARAWRPNVKHKKAPHGSREHYDRDPKAQALFKVEHTRIKFMPLPTDSKKDSPDLVAYAKNLGLSSDDFRRAVGLERVGDKLAEDSEANAIQWFKHQFGYIPMLNRREEGKGDRAPTDKELIELLKKT